jgi:phosphate starvation-inducible protein PhoH
MNKIVFIHAISNIIYINGFNIKQIINTNYITHLSSKKSNKFNNNNIDYFENEFNSLNADEYQNMKERYKPKGINQENYVKYLNDDHIPLIFALGPAGSGKTLFACVQAIKALKSKSITKIILTRPIVAVEDEEIGFLPGNLQHKMDPWTKPIFDIFLEYYKQYEIDNMIKESIIEISPLSYMRGRTFKNSFIICDEMQNSTPNQMLMLTTRIGNGSKMIITGDLLQSDRQINNGLSDIIMKINNYQMSNDLNNIKIIKMTHSDIQRSELVKNILNIYNN